MNYTFPFTAIVGMDQVKKSLLYNAVDPKLGGLLLMGHRGCAKSTLVRSFGEILPTFEKGVMAPFVEVPLGATEDRLLGSVDASRLLKKGEWSEQTGLIQKADSGVLYVDEVNLLPDHLVDSILDSAANGIHRIEREGLSKIVDARYILIGSMNPEEGDLRPQLKDRFMHGIFVKDDFSVEQRREIVRLRMDFDDDPKLFLEAHLEKLQKIKSEIIQVRKLLKFVEITENIRTEVAEKAASLNCEGLRAEIGVLRTVRCAAAWRGETKITPEDLDEAWYLCLGHRQDIIPPNQRQNIIPPNHQNSKSETNLSQTSEGDKVSKRIEIPQTSLSPTSALTKSIKIDKSMEKVSNELDLWWQSLAKKKQSENFFCGSTRPMSTNNYRLGLCWRSSLMVSLLSGWSPGQSWASRYRRPVRRDNFWLFVDASRSSGSMGMGPSGSFLSDIRNSLIRLGGGTLRYRFHLLVLQNDRVDWRVKRGTLKALRNNLNQIYEASGKSYLTSAMSQLRNAVQKQGVLNGDRILLCTDGMLSPEIGKTVSETKRSFRNSLLSLSEKITNTAWIHPQFQRGMRHWVPNLVDGTRIYLIPLD